MDSHRSEDTLKSRSIIPALLWLVGIATGDLLACGDKFLVVGRGSRFQKAAVPRQPATILIYANPASNLPTALADLPVEDTLRKVGYRPTSVGSTEEFDRALREGGWDLILVDMAESRAVSGRAHGGAASVVLPVVYNPTRTEWKEARKQYASVLRSPTKTQAFLETIDEALSSRPQVKPAGKITR